MAQRNKRLNYGPAKYAAFHLLLCRWMRHHAHNGQFQYITLGGTELRDIQSLHYVDHQCTCCIISFEFGKSEYELACGTRDRVHAIGLQVDVRRGDIFKFQRGGHEPHLFFIDLKGCCVLSEYDEKFAGLLSDEHIRPGDSLFITSHLGARRGWTTLLAEYAEELDTLEVAGMANRRLCFRRCHPSFTLFRALHLIGFQSVIGLRCFACVEYRDKTPMALFGYTITQGTTTFLELVQNAPYFHIRHGLPSSAAG